ncbi:MAG TPA: formate/nitrite transporter family protein [Rhodanobacteraceae bacterium]|jgi:formate/nitrite transporter FocA (FNT family)|nr:formate/nitrite transporter family protein [Rhodanobacteraceae bacterium]
MADDPRKRRPRKRKQTDDEPEGSFRISARERHDVEGNLPPRVQVLHEAIRVAGKTELARSAAALSWSSLAAGLSMGFSMLVPALLYVHLVGVSGGFLIVKLGYTVGFLIVVSARQQLFTENTLTAVLPFMTQPDWHALGRVLRLWGIVLVGNLVGVALFACGMVYMHVLDAATHAALVSQAEELMRNSILQMFTKGILAGWLLGTMVWLIPALPNAKVFVIVLMTWLIGLGNFTHIIAGSTEVLYLVFRGDLPAMDYIVRFALPTLAGNIIGGSVIFGLISHAQVRSDDG